MHTPLCPTTLWLGNYAKLNQTLPSTNLPQSPCGYLQLTSSLHWRTRKLPPQASEVTGISSVKAVETLLGLNH